MQTNRQITAEGISFRLMQCGNCGVWHAFPETIYDHAYREGGFWTCPNGHSRGWKEGAEKQELETLRREKERLVQNGAYLESRIREESDRAATAEKKYQQARRRAAAGVCPCCNRTFVNVQRHMMSKHKNVVPIAQKSSVNGS